MNKEYLYLSDKELLVIDELGHATKRNVETTNMQDVLLLENSLEEMNERIMELEKRVDQDKESKLTTKGKIIFAMSPFIVGVSVFAMLCLSNFPGDSHLIAIGSTLGTCAVVVGAIDSEKQHIRFMNGRKSELEKAYELREDLEQKLSKMKEKSQDSITTNLVESQNLNLPIHDVIALGNSTPLEEKVRQQLEEAFVKGYEQKVKKRTLKKENPQKRY